MALRISAADAPYKRVKDAVTFQRTPYNLRANATDDHGVCTTTLMRARGAPTACRRPYCAAMVTLRRIHCALIRTPSDGVCFEHPQSARRLSAFYAIPQRLLSIPLGCCGDAYDRTARTLAFCIFLGRRGIAVRRLLWCDRGFRREDNTHLT